MAAARAISSAVAVIRIAIGAVLLIAPARFGRPWFGEAAKSPGGGAAVRCLGARDLALGLLTVVSLRDRFGTPSTAATLVAAGAVCDAVDGVALHLGRDQDPPLRPMTSAGAWITAVVGFGLAWRLRADS